MYEQLKLENQLCFLLYSLSREVTARYRPLLEALDLTYPQYLVMLVLWENNKLNVKEIGEKLRLDSGTLTPLLKRLVQKALIIRERAENDERQTTITLTPLGEALQEQAKAIPDAIHQCLALDAKERAELHRLLTRLF